MIQMGEIAIFVPFFIADSLRDKGWSQIIIVPRAFQCDIRQEATDKTAANMAVAKIGAEC